MKTEGFEPRNQKKDGEIASSNGGLGAENRKRCIETAQLEGGHLLDDAVHSEDDVNEKTIEDRGISSDPVQAVYSFTM